MIICTIFLTIYIYTSTNYKHNKEREKMIYSSITLDELISDGIHCDACDRTWDEGDPESIEAAVRLIAQNIKKWIEEA